jgi:pimeloyl-ACP methyl ester carboxylesterase
LYHLVTVVMSQEIPLYQPSSGNLRFAFPNSESPVKFDIKVDEDLIQFAKDRASTYRVSHGLYPDWSNEGAPAKTMADLAKYWAQTYDWKAIEDRINSQFDHFATTVPGNREYDAPIRIHFVHQPSQNKDAIPLLMLHGWTSSHLEWSTVAPRLSDKFHIVAPDLPGYGFSPAPTRPGLGPREMGLAFDAMMKQLGYARYGLASTDLGGMVAAWMAADIPQSIIGHFADFLLLVPTPADIERAAKGEVTAEEGAYMAAMGEWSTNHFAYASIQGQKPLAMSHSMADSPVGFAGWIWDLKHVASDGYVYSHEEIITETLMQWIQEPYASLRPYIEFLKARKTSPILGLSTNTVSDSPKTSRAFPGLKCLPALLNGAM